MHLGGQHLLLIISEPLHSLQSCHSLVPVRTTKSHASLKEIVVSLMPDLI